MSIEMNQLKIFDEVFFFVKIQMTLKTRVQHTSEA